MRNPISHPRRRGFASKLLASHLWVAAIGFCIFIVAFGSTLLLSFDIRALVQHGAPIAQTSAIILAEVQRSQSYVRGWVSLGNKRFDVNWRGVWSTGIEPALDALMTHETVFPEYGVDQFIRNLIPLLEDLKESQWWIRKMAQAPGNEPARVIYLQEVGPIALEIEKIVASVSAFLETEKLPGSTNMLSHLYRGRNDFMTAYLLLEKYVAGGKLYHQEEFYKNIRECRRQFDAAGLDNLVSPDPRYSWHTLLARELTALQKSAEQVILIRTSDQWNLAKYYLSTESDPLTDNIITIATTLSLRSAERMEKLSVDAGRATRLALVIMGVATLAMLALGFFLTRTKVKALMLPIQALAAATEKFAAGSLDTDIAVLSNDELGDLTQSFNTMRASLSRARTDLAGANRLLQQREKKRVAALAESEQRMSLIADSLPVLISQIDSRHHYLFVNKEYERWFGVAPEEIIGKHIKEIIGEQTHVHITDKLARALAGEVVEYEDQARLPNGTLIHIHVIYVPHRDESGHVDSIFSMAEDISSRKKAEVALQESEKRFRTLVDTAPDGILIFDAVSDKIVTANPSACRLLGYAQEDLLNKSWFDISALLQRDGGQTKSLINSMLKKALQGAPVLSDWLFTRKDGREVLTEMRINRIDEGDNHMVRASLTDITEKREMLLQLQHAHKMEAVGTLAGGIAHEFNNVLGIIMGNTELALDDVPDWSPAYKNLEAVKEASFRARDVVRGLLSFSRKTEHQKKWVDIMPIVKESLKMLRSSIPANIDIQQHIAPQSATIFADPTQIHQVMINLCTNSAHALEKKGGLIQVGLQPVEVTEEDRLRPELVPGRYVHLSISDTGCGIAPQIMDRIFDPFFTTKEVRKGTGLGLAVVHGIVADHNGLIFVQSEVDKGTCFDIFFPSYEQRPESKEQDITVLPGGSETILFVDDEQMIVDLVKEILERLGYHVDALTDAGRALALFSEDPMRYDLVITDMAMPHMTGEDLTKGLLGLRADLPIILNTGFSDHMDQEKAKAIGIRKYLEKPLDRSRLAKAVREVLDAKGMTNDK